MIRPSLYKSLKYNTLIDEMDLPKYLYNDLRTLEAKWDDKTCLHLDCLQDEVSGSINSALADNRIDKSVAIYLYEYFLGQIVDL